MGMCSDAIDAIEQEHNGELLYLTELVDERDKIIAVQEETIAELQLHVQSLQLGLRQLELGLILAAFHVPEPERSKIMAQLGISVFSVSGQLN